MANKIAQVADATPVQETAVQAEAEIPGSLDQLQSELEKMMTSGGNSAVAGDLLGMDLSGVQADVRVLLPIEIEGADGMRTPIMYESQIISAKLEKAANTNNPMIVVKLKTLFPVQHRGVTLYDNIMLTEGSKWRLRGFMEAIDGIDENGKIIVGVKDLPGFVVRHTLIIDMYNGAPRNKMGPSYMAAFEAPELVAQRGAEATAVAATPTGNPFAG